MKSVSYLGLCWLTTFGLVAAALGQQQATEQPFPLDPSASPAAAGQPASEIQQLGAPATQQDQLRQPAFNQPAGTQQQSGMTAMPSARQPRGEIGVWMIESGGPGVEITRITGGSAAERAGLRSGDIILQVNGRGAFVAADRGAIDSPGRDRPAGHADDLRDGDQRQLQVTMQPARESHEVSFRGEGTDASGDLSARTIRLEQQLNTVMQELQQLRQEMAQLRTSVMQPAAYNTESTPRRAAETRHNPANRDSNKFASAAGDGNNRATAGIRAA